MQPKTTLLAACLLFFYTVRAQAPVEVKYKNYTVDRSVKEDSKMLSLLQPFTDSVDRFINSTIAFSNVTMYKKQPESALGNLMTDAMKVYASKKFNTNVDAAFINYGSIRSYIPKGEIKLQTLYDLCPYDNFIVIQKIDGNKLHQLLDLIANKGGWPCSGIRMKIKYRKASEILVNGAQLNDTSVYTIAVSDYLAKGGEGCTMLKDIAQQNKNVLYKEALVDFVRSFTAAGKPLSATLENRIENVEE